MTDNLDDLLANVDDLDDFLREPVDQKSEQDEPENIEVSLNEKEISETLKEEPPAFDVQADEGAGSPTLSAPIPEPPVEKVPGAPKEPSSEYSIPGSKEWNTSAPYYITIDAASLAREQAQLANIFFFVDAPVSDVEGDDVVKKALIDYMRKPDRDLKEKYRVFLYQELLKELLEINTLFLDKDGDEKELYYHIGPLTVFRIFMAKFKHEKRGYCFCYSGAGKGVRLFPEETIKSVIMDWYRDNIFTSHLDFDNLSLYDRVKRKVNGIYREDRKRFHTLLEKVNMRAGKGRSVSPTAFLSMKGNDIIGPAKMQIYKRFIGNNLFL